jgi:hypothetical protein
LWCRPFAPLSADTRASARSGAATGRMPRAHPMSVNLPPAFPNREGPGRRAAAKIFNEAGRRAILHTTMRFCGFDHFDAAPCCHVDGPPVLKLSSMFVMRWGPEKATYWSRCVS